MEHVFGTFWLAELKKSNGMIDMRDYIWEVKTK